MPTVELDGILYRRARRIGPVLLLSLLAACSSSSPPVEDQDLGATASTSAPPKTSEPSSNGGTAKFDAGGGNDSRGNMAATGTQAGSTGSSTGMDAGVADGAGGKSGAGGTSSMDAGVAGSAAGANGGKAGNGSAGASGKAGNAGASGTQGMDDDDAGVCIPLDKPLNTSFGKCSMELCPAQDSVCVPSSLLTSLKIKESSIKLLADCNDQYKCVPEALANTGGRVLLTTCKSINGAEGRCLSSCVPSVAVQATLLPKDVCQGTDLCAPCFDPRTGEDTGACEQGCDTGPKEPPKPFIKCCSDRGLCVPPALAGDQAKNLNKEACAEDTLCAPKELADPTFKAKTCDSLDGAEGRCISTCVGGAVAKQKDRLPTTGCGTEEVCAPCYDPVTGEDTGACTVNGDKPTKPKQVFPNCCGMSGTQPVGVCVSPDLAGEQASILRQETCAMGKLCAPVKKAQDPTFKFKTCSSLLGAGACVNSCIVDPSQAAILTRSGCEADELCAPCDLLGETTHACD